MQRIIIIGGGPAGYSAAIRAAQLNNDVVLIEKEALGGTCLNKGCIPTKALLHSSHLYANAKSSDYILNADNLQADITKIYGRSFDIVKKLNNGVQALIKANGIKYYNNTAELVNSSAVKLDTGEIVEGDKIILATGARPAILPIKGIEYSHTSDDILMHNFEKYDSVVVIGGGVVGIELATFFSDLGSKVTVIDIMDSILSAMKGNIARYVSLPLKKKRVKFHLGSKVVLLNKTDEAIVTEFIEKDKPCSVTSDIVISCAGRIPNGILGMERTNIFFDNGFVVNENSQTSEENIFAVGDCVRGNVQLAHYAAADGIRVVESFNNQIIRPLANTPSCVYTSPNAAVVGKQQEDCSFEVEIGKFNMGANGKTLAEGGNMGYIKVVFDKESSRLIGAEMVCNNACELAGFISNMINKGLTREDILHTVYPHPSVSEGFFEAVEDSQNKSIHTIYKK